MYHYAMKISYDGSAYRGWQRLKHTPDTVQGRLEDVLSHLLMQPAALRGSGRTDAGVHALAQTADFFCSKKLNCADFLAKANARLPEDIRILTVFPVQPAFHSRKSCLQKTYAYCVSLNAKPDVFTTRYTYHPATTPLMLPPDSDYNALLGLDLMQKAAAMLIGTHDFSAFTSDKQNNRSHVRTLTDITFQIQQHPHAVILVLKFTGNGFLYNMVRILAGTLLEVGFGRRNTDEIPGILNSRIRSMAGPTLPPNALFLCQTNFDYNA